MFINVDGGQRCPILNVDFYRCSAVMAVGAMR